MRAGVRALMGVFLLAGVGLVLAQEPKKDPEPPPRVKGMLPKFFKSLGLSDEQRQAIYALQARYGGRIEVLAEQIRKLRAEEAMEIDKVLTEAQKARLRELRLGEIGKPKDKDAEKKPDAEKKSEGEKKPEDKKSSLEPRKLAPPDKNP
jgi:hypothetical protein